MTAYEILSVVIGIIGLLISFGGLLIALLSFLDKRNKESKKPTLSANRMGGVR